MLKDLVPEYRRAAAKLALWLEEHEAAGDRPPDVIRSTKEALRDIREVQRLLDGYYNVPRTAGISAFGWKTGKGSHD